MWWGQKEVMAQVWIRFSIWRQCSATTSFQCLKYQSPSLTAHTLRCSHQRSPCCPPQPCLVYVRAARISQCCYMSTSVSFNDSFWLLVTSPSAALGTNKLWLGNTMQLSAAERGRRFFASCILLVQWRKKIRKITSNPICEGFVFIYLWVSNKQHSAPTGPLSI